jgi:hypothetical protein
MFSTVRIRAAKPTGQWCNLFVFEPNPSQQGLEFDFGKAAK